MMAGKARPIATTCVDSCKVSVSVPGVEQCWTGTYGRYFQRLNNNEASLSLVSAFVIVVQEIPSKRHDLGFHNGLVVLPYPRGSSAGPYTHTILPDIVSH